MTTEAEPRKYQLKARAEGQRETRARIAEATAELHEEVGVARTTVAEIARRAGVSRLTVYNHFPDLDHLLPACTAHYEQRHPAPDFDAALQLGDPAARVLRVLELLYGWYREVEPMFGKLFSDRATVPELDRHLSRGIDVLQDHLAEGLAGGLTASEPLQPGVAARRHALLRLAVDFPTWKRLGDEGLDDREAADLMASAVLHA